VFTWRVVLLALPLIAASLAAAELGDFARRFTVQPFFAGNAESTLRTAARKPAIDHDDLPNPREDVTRAGDWAVSAGGALPLRFFDHPSVEAMGGGGIDFLFRPLDTLGCFFSASLWAGRVKTKSGDWTKGESQIHSEFDAFELVTGARVYAHRWGSGAIYLDLRLAYLVVDGADPVLRTQSAGGDVYFGIEIGVKPAYFFIEGGYGTRFALFRDNQGWVGTGKPQGTNMGRFVDFTRMGLRIYF
jgi:hypothetical protein